MTKATARKAERKGVNGPDLLHHYEQLLLVRRSEERLQTLFADGEVPGFIHLSIGQEAVSVGVMSALGPDDTIGSTHRGHGHAIAKGIPLDRFFAELLARDNGVCRGRGGSMHVADMSVGMLGANGIVGAGLPIALGSALAHRNLRNGNIAVSFFGDGALAEGVLHETFNMASLWKLPILFVCEANGWSEFSPVNQQIAFDLQAWSRSYGIPYHNVDGNDVTKVAEMTQEIVEFIRADGGPALLECVTSRIRGHYEGDAQKYRAADDVPTPEPVAVAHEQLIARGAGEQALAELADRVAAQVEAAVAAARSGPVASFEAALADVYTLKAAA